MKKIIRTAFIYLVFSVIFEVGMAAIIEMKGVAESVGNIAVRPMGLIIHTHLLILGFFFFVIMALLEKVFSITEQKPFKLFYETYNIGLLVSVIIIAYRSFGEIFGYTANKMYSQWHWHVGSYFRNSRLVCISCMLKEIGNQRVAVLQSFLR